MDVKRLDKIMVAANKKLGGHARRDQPRRTVERAAIADQGIRVRARRRRTASGTRSRPRMSVNATRARRTCARCAVFRGHARPDAAGRRGGGAPAGLGAPLGGGSGGTAISGGGAAAAGGGAALLGSLGAKTAALCISAVCAAGGAVVIVESARDAERPPDSTANSHPASHRPVASAPRRVATTAPTSSVER